jgi:hypothetical protein
VNTVMDIISLLYAALIETKILLLTCTEFCHTSHSPLELTACPFHVLINSFTTASQHEFLDILTD